jgi:hypothetical protein
LNLAEALATISTPIGLVDEQADHKSLKFKGLSERHHNNAPAFTTGVLTTKRQITVVDFALRNSCAYETTGVQWPTRELAQN